MPFSKPLYSTLLLWFGFMLAVSGWAQDKRTEPFSAELVKRAEAVDAKAQCSLGFAYSSGKEVTRDYKEALKWYTKAAEQGNEYAKMELKRIKGQQ